MYRKNIITSQIWFDLTILEIEFSVYRLGNFDGEFFYKNSQLSFSQYGVELCLFSRIEKTSLNPDWNFYNDKVRETFPNWGKGAPRTSHHYITCQNYTITLYYMWKLKRLDMGHLISKLNSMTVPVLPALNPSLIFLFHLLPSPVTLTEFSFCIFHGRN